MRPDSWKIMLACTLSSFVWIRLFYIFQLFILRIFFRRPSNAFRSVKQAFRFGRLSRSSSIDDDQKSLMGNHRRGSGMNDYESTDGGMSSDVETGGLHLDYEDKEDEYDGDEETRGNGETRSEKKKTPR